MDLFSDAEKSGIASLIQDVHDSFSRTIYVYSEPSRTVINTNQSFLYKYPRESSDVDFVPNVATISARILYGKPKNEILADGTKYNDVPVDVPAGWVRIKIEAANYQTLASAKRITLDGFDFIIDSHSRGHGVFDINYYTFYLRPINNE